MRILKQNRLQARRPSKRLFYCGCDRSHVGQSGKCSACGATYKGVKDKKAGPPVSTSD